MRVEDVVFSLKLWVYSDPEANGSFPIYLQLYCAGDRKYLTTGFHSSQSYWDSEKDVLLDSHPQYQAILDKTNSLKDDVKFEIRKSLENGDDFLTLADIKKKVKEKSKPQYEKPASRKKFYEFTQQVIEECFEEDRPGTASVFVSCRNSLKKVIKTDKAFTAFTKEDFQAYEKFLKKTVPEDSSISVYLRTFYRIWNIAQKKKLCPEKHHPKFHIEFKPYRRFESRKRTIEKKYIDALWGLKLDISSRHNRSRYVFLLLYYTRGMEFCDAALLKKGENWAGNRLKYRRQKSGRKYDFKLHPKAVAILKYFENYPLQSDGGYILPYITSKHDTAKKIKQRIISALRDVNEDLLDLEKMIKCPKHITTKVAKHAIASHLLKKRVDMKFIQETLGHETELQTRIYTEALDFDDEVADTLEAVI
ncbi:site-specific integrase [Chitinophaga tropicalis]|uniref:Tyrosine-type recombinase/integrase n=1 Tax=Chitinophaga tropicalis TaxID=2683588 RepID=A0A7K1U070_9BACT|nr:site-specific integrase [Chitinophaga tropicalis]MVT07758.1 tyrosine-type recombinase/integrase [Chitinophaga tropicalis]